MNRLVYCSVIWISVIFPAISQTQEVAWARIRPLRSTRVDVEKLLGKPTKPEINLYETDGEKIVVWYSEGTCKQGNANLWNVPRDTVLAILVSLKQRASVSDIAVLQSEQFKGKPDQKNPGIIDYTSKDGSVRYQTVILSDGQEDVQFISISPSNRDDPLRCRRRT